MRQTNTRVPLWPLNSIHRGQTRITNSKAFESRTDLEITAQSRIIGTCNLNLTRLSAKTNQNTKIKNQPFS
jgi:hypothetical protein